MLKKYLQSKITIAIIAFLGGLMITGLFSGEEQKPLPLETTSSSPEKTLTWTCAMHPQIQQSEPGQCPICGMDLIPLDDASDQSASPRQLEMTEAAKQLAQIQTAPVERRLVDKVVRMVGKVEYDETLLNYLTAWFPGRIERMYVNFTGIPVQKGDHLVEIYSPELFSDQEALLQAMQAAPATRSENAVLRNKQQMIKRAEERLRLKGLTDRQIQEIKKRGTPSERITFYSPIDGVVIHKNALEGDYVKEGTRIFTIADLTHLWVKMDAYETDLQWIRYGQDVTFTTVAYPGETFHGQVAFIAPYLNEKTRTAKVRVNVENPQGKLKPEMFVNAELRSNVTQAGEVFDPSLAGKWLCYMHPEVVQDTPGECRICGMPLVTAASLGYAGGTKPVQPPLLVPETAPLITGTRAVVYVQVPNQEKPTYEGREVVLGPKVEGYYVVHSGLREGEQVVVNGNFKIDSALQIKAKPSMMNPEGGGSGGAMAHSGSMREAPESPSAKVEVVSSPVPNPTQLKALLPPYRTLSHALADGDLAAAKRAWRDAHIQADRNRWTVFHHLEEMITNPDSIEELRLAFAELSDVMIQALKQHGAPEGVLYQVHCPMVFDNRGADWLQWEKEIRNPYAGESMLTCGTIQQTFGE